ncbi:MAG: cohesin domain-containing protein [Candidatus Falkowbacteria bacterium]
MQNPQKEKTCLPVGRAKIKKVAILGLISIVAFSFCASINLFIPIAASAGSASLFLSPASGTFKVGQTFSIGVYVSSADQAMNAVSGTITFPKDKLEVASVSKSGSVLTLWVQDPQFSNSGGTISFEGIAFNPGFQGKSGKILSVTFKAKATGSAAVKFSSGSVLANDGQGTELISGLGSATFTVEAAAKVETPAPTPKPVVKPITEAEKKKAAAKPAAIKPPTAPSVSSPTHPDSEQWYAARDIELTWQLDAITTKVSTLLDSSPTSSPSDNSEGLFVTKKLTKLDDGISYFHIKAGNDGGWSAVVHRKILIDTTAPDNFEIKVDNGGDETNPQPILTFSTKDSLSGLDHYEICSDGSQPEIIGAAMTSYKMPTQNIGQHLVAIKAVDKVGNATTQTAQFAVEALERPGITNMPSLVKPSEPFVLAGTTKYASSYVVLYLYLDKEKTDKILGKDWADKFKDELVVSGSLVVEREETIKIKIPVGNDGKWGLNGEIKLPAGIYQAAAQVFDSRGARSDMTEKTNFVVVPEKFSTLDIIHLSAFAIFVMLAAGLAAALIYCVGLKKQVKGRV